MITVNHSKLTTYTTDWHRSNPLSINALTTTETVRLYSLVRTMVCTMYSRHVLALGVTSVGVRPRSTWLDYCNALSRKQIIIDW